MNQDVVSSQYDAQRADSEPRSIDEDQSGLLARAHRMPLRLVLEVPAVEFTVRSLMELRIGSIVTTAAQHNEDLILHANGQLIGMAKFDVTGDVLAVRLTGVA